MQTYFHVPAYPDSKGVERQVCGMAEKGVFPLGGLPLGAEGTIAAVSAEGELRRRLTELGYFPGERVKKVLVSPLGDPCAYLVRGTVTAIRRRDAESILIREAGEWD